MGVVASVATVTTEGRYSHAETIPFSPSASQNRPETMLAFLRSGGTVDVTLHWCADRPLYPSKVGTAAVFTGPKQHSVDQLPPSTHLGIPGGSDDSMLAAAHVTTDYMRKTVLDSRYMHCSKFLGRVIHPTKRLRTSSSTVRRWCHTGSSPCIRTPIKVPLFRDIRCGGYGHRPSHMMGTTYLSSRWEAL